MQEVAAYWEVNLFIFLNPVFTTGRPSIHTLLPGRLRMGEVVAVWSPFNLFARVLPIISSKCWDVRERGLGTPRARNPLHCVPMERSAAAISGRGWSWNYFNAAEWFEPSLIVCFKLQAALENTASDLVTWQTAASPVNTPRLHLRIHKHQLVLCGYFPHVNSGQGQEITQKWSHFCNSPGNWGDGSRITEQLLYLTLCCMTACICKAGSDSFTGGFEYWSVMQHRMLHEGKMIHNNPETIILRGEKGLITKR